MSNEIGIYAAERMRYYCENDSEMGYDQSQRNDPHETDCSQLVLRCYDEALRHYGLPGLNTTGYTGNMCAICKAAGAEVYDFDGNIYDLDVGDAIVNESAHTEMCVGDGLWGGANQDENGGISGGQPGDQTGYEVYIKNPYNYSWNKVISWVNFDIGSASPVEAQAKIRVYTREDGWLEWVTREGCEDGCGDDFAGIAGHWIYGFEANECGNVEVERADGTRDGGAVGQSAITGIHLYGDVNYQAHWLGANPGWGKVEHSDDDDGAGKDANSPLDMVKLV